MIRTRACSFLQPVKEPARRAGGSLLLTLLAVLLGGLLLLGVAASIGTP